MEQPHSREYGLSDGVRLSTALARAGVYVFTTQWAIDHAPQGLTAQRIRYLLKVLAASGWIVRLRRDLYAGTGRLPGGVDVPPFAVATSLVSPAVISHLSALSFHGLTDQLPFVVTASTPRKVVTPSMRRPGGGAEGRHLWRVQGIDYRYVTVIPSRFELGQETVWLDERFRVSITDRERSTSLRCLGYSGV
jgi:predicted transcriptional regulator of viral defense system